MATTITPDAFGQSDETTVDGARERGIVKAAVLAATAGTTVLAALTGSELAQRLAINTWVVWIFGFLTPWCALSHLHAHYGLHREWKSSNRTRKVLAKVHEVTELVSEAWVALAHRAGVPVLHYGPETRKDWKARNAEAGVDVKGVTIQKLYVGRMPYRTDANGQMILPPVGKAIDIAPMLIPIIVGCVVIPHIIL